MCLPLQINFKRMGVLSIYLAQNNINATNGGNNISKVSLALQH